MSENKLKILSLSLDPEMYELVKSSARKLGHKNVSQMIRDLVSKYLDLLVNDNDDTPIILRVPNSVKENPDDLRSWLNSKMENIIKALSQNADSTT